MPAPTLSLAGSRASDARRLSELRGQVAEKGLGGMPFREIVTIEELYQLELNGELEPGLNDAAISRLAEIRKSQARARLGRGLSPFESTQYSRWEWVPQDREYRFVKAEGVGFNPRDTGSGRWKPSLLQEAGIGEGFGRRL